MIWGIWVEFPKLPQHPSTCETGITQPTKAFDTRVRSHLMWNKELKTLGYCSCVCARDLGYLAPVSPNCPNTWVLVKQVFNSSYRGHFTLVQGLIWCEVRSWNFALLFMCLCILFGVFGPSFPRLRSDCMWNVVLKILY